MTQSRKRNSPSTIDARVIRTTNKNAPPRSLADVQNRAIGFLQKAGFNETDREVFAERFDISVGMAIDARWTFLVENQATVITEEQVDWRGHIVAVFSKMGYELVGKKNKRVHCQVHEIAFAPVRGHEPRPQNHLVIFLDSKRYYDIATKTCISYWTAGRAFGGPIEAVITDVLVTEEIVQPPVVEQAVESPTVVDHPTAVFVPPPPRHITLEQISKALDALVDTSFEFENNAPNRTREWESTNPRCVMCGNTNTCQWPGYCVFQMIDQHSAHVAKRSRV